MIPTPRFSLGGMQGKFTLSRVGGKWFWPNAATPSTHILKPEGVGTPGAEVNESGMLRLAAACGVETTDSGIAVFDGHHSFMTARFDRETVDGKPVRIHAEDVCSALGVPAGSKYDVRAADVLSLLHRIDPDDGLAYAWIGQLAFSTYSGNADAHARNYTLLAATEDGYRLSPLYDAVCTACWPALSTRLAMPVGGEDRASRVGDAEWAALARSNRLDEGRVVDMARNMASGSPATRGSRYAGSRPPRRTGWAGCLSPFPPSPGVKCVRSRPHPRTPAWCGSRALAQRLLGGRLLAVTPHALTPSVPTRGQYQPFSLASSRAFSLTPPITLSSRMLHRSRNSRSASVQSMPACSNARANASPHASSSSRSPSS